MSLQQRLRAFKFAVEDKKQQISKSPPVAAVLGVIAAVRAAFQPLSDAIAALKQRWESMCEDYNQFLAEETKKKWTWSKRNRQELEFLAGFPGYAFGKIENSG